MLRISRWGRRRARRGADRQGQLETRLGDLGRTVGEPVTLDDVDEVLRRVVVRAARAVQAQRHLIAAALDGRRHVHGSGFATGEARTLGRRLLDDGRADLMGAASLRSRVATARQDLGWLAVFVPRAGRFLPGEQEHLDAYAAVTAGALEAMTSTVQARRSKGELLLWDPDEPILRTVSAVAFGAKTAEAFDFSIPTVASPSSWRLSLGSVTGRSPSPPRRGRRSPRPGPGDAHPGFAGIRSG